MERLNQMMSSGIVEINLKHRCEQCLFKFYEDNVYSIYE